MLHRLPASIAIDPRDTVNCDAKSWGPSMIKYKLICTLGLGDILIQFLLWLLLIVITCGIAIPFFGYYFIRIILNHTEIHQIA